MALDVKLVRIGNSLSFRVPRSVVEELHLSQGSVAELSVENHSLVLRPKVGYTLEGLLSQITPENLHAEISFGNEVGCERVE